MNSNGLISRMNNWLAHPFNAQGNVWDWFLFLGVIVVAVYLWNNILGELAEGVGDAIS